MPSLAEEGLGVILLRHNATLLGLYLCALHEAVENCYLETLGPVYWSTETTFAGKIAH